MASSKIEIVIDNGFERTVDAIITIPPINKNASYDIESPKPQSHPQPFIVYTNVNPFTVIPTDTPGYSKVLVYPENPRA